jgi:butyryl-CoA dehydrogenase
MSEVDPRWLAPDKLEELAARAEQADRDPAWPADSLRLAQELGAMKWSIPPDFGGAGLDRIGQLERTEELASACLTTAFLLSQREAAVRWLLSANSRLQRRFLPACANGDIFVTVGLSQLTTSGQHRPPSLRAHTIGQAAEPTGYRLDGDVPWVTGADHAAGVVIGAVLEDGRQVLLLLTPEDAGVGAEPPLSLSALAGSRTARILCAGVELSADRGIAGPGTQLVRTGGGLDTSCLALGLARAAIGFLARESIKRPYIQPAMERLAGAWREARRQLHARAAGNPPAEAVLELRVECTRLVLRATQAALAVAKGTGFVTPHPAQRWVRQAQFFLVWSCPQSVASALLADLTAIPT